MEKKGKLYDRIVAHGKDRELQEARQQIQQLQNEVESLTQQLMEDQPYWIVSSEEIGITDEVIGRGGWGEVRVANFRKLRVAAKYLYEGIVSGYNSRLFCLPDITECWLHKHISTADITMENWVWFTQMEIV